METMSQPVFIDAEVPGVVVDPTQGGVTVRDRSGERRLWGEAIADRDADAAKRAGPAVEAAVIAAVGAVHVPAAMDRHQARTRVGDVPLSVRPHRHVRIPPCSAVEMLDLIGEATGIAQ